MGHLLIDVRRILTLFAGFAIGIHVAVFLHELGHAIGVWIAGGHVNAIIMHAPATAEGSMERCKPLAQGVGGNWIRLAMHSAAVAGRMVLASVIDDTFCCTDDRRILPRS